MRNLRVLTTSVGTKTFNDTLDVLDVEVDAIRERVKKLIKKQNAAKKEAQRVYEGGMRSS